MTDEVVIPATEVAPEASGTATPVEAPVSGDLTPESQPTPKVFTQEEVNAIVAKEKSKVERKAQRERDRAIADAVRPQPEKVEAPAKPTPDKFTTTEDYVEALAGWKAEEIVGKKLSEAKTQDQQRQQQDAATELQATFEEREAAARAKYPDYDTVARNPELPITTEMALVIKQSDSGPDIALFLGKNVDECRRIAQLSPFLQAKELGRIEAKLAATPAAPAHKTSSAPDPIVPVGGKGGSQPALDPTDPRSDKLSTDEWMRAENARMRKKLEAQGYR